MLAILRSYDGHACGLGIAGCSIHPDHPRNLDLDRFVLSTHTDCIGKKGIGIEGSKYRARAFADNVSDLRLFDMLAW